MPIPLTSHPELRCRSHVYLLERYAMEQSHGRAIGRIGKLTDREQQVAALAKSGLSNKDIAKSLGLSEGTVKHHLHRVFQKLGVRRRSALQQPLSMRASKQFSAE
jgi:DNA-binding NarL/FixJ family response regulator